MWVFLNHLTDGCAELSQHSPCLQEQQRWRSPDQGIPWARESRDVLVAEGVTRLNVLEAHKGNDVTSLCAVEFDAVISTHFNDTTDTFGFTGECVKNGRAFRSLPE